MNAARETSNTRPGTVAEYQAIFRRRKWIVLGLPLLAALCAYALSARETAEYQAKSQVYFDLSSIPVVLENLNVLQGDPTTYLTNQARLARSPALAENVVAATGLPRASAGRFLDRSKANPVAGTSILELSALSSDRDVARRLANTYADEFVQFKTNRDTEKLKAYEESLRSRHPAPGSAEYEALVRLETLGGQLANNASVLQHAFGAAKVNPRPVRNAVLALLLGAVLGLGLAFLAEALDRRARTEEEIEQALGFPRLGRVPRPPRRLSKNNKLVMLEEPSSLQAQTFRRLRTSLEFANHERRARLIMITSALPREGKSTTVANLAVSLARARRRVAVVDLDLRRPALHTFFDTGSDHGFTDVVVHRLMLSRAFRSIALPGAGQLPSMESNGRPPSPAGGASNGQAGVDCVLDLLPSGTIPPAADEFLESSGIDSVLEELRNQFDVVLVDTPPLLAVGDAMALSTKVDAIVAVTRVGIQRRPLEELARQLRTCRAPVLGFILTGAPHGDSYSYGYGYDPRGYVVPQEAEKTVEPS